MKNNLRLMIALWVFALALCGLVIVWMLNRGPAFGP